MNYLLRFSKENCSFQDLCLEVLTVHGSELRLVLGPDIPPYSTYFCIVSGLASVGIILPFLFFRGVWPRFEPSTTRADMHATIARSDLSTMLSCT